MKYINTLFAMLLSTLLIGACSIINADPNFELLNKSNKVLLVDIKTGGSSIPISYVQPNDTLEKTIPSNMPIRIKLQEKGMTGQAIFKKITPTTKTKYITFNPSKSPSVYPQTGPLMGLVKKTDSGLSLSNNITANDILNIPSHEFDKAY